MLQAKSEGPSLSLNGTFGPMGKVHGWDTQMKLVRCAGFGWGRVNFLHSSWYGAMFWICDENSVDNTGMFSLLLSSAYTESRPFLLLKPPHQRVGWGCTRGREGTQPGQLTPTDQRAIPYHMTSCSAYKAGGRRRKGGTLGVMVFLKPHCCYRHSFWLSIFLQTEYSGLFIDTSLHSKYFR